MGDSDTCPISEAVASSKYDQYVRDLTPEKGNALLPSKHSRGAIVSLYAVTNQTEGINSWKCQLLNHERYCERHGYTCYFILDSDEWKASRTGHEGSSLYGYWLKFQVIPRVLRDHPWILYLDADTVFGDPETAPSIDSILTENAKNRSLVSLYMPGGKGWGTDMMFFRNTLWSHKYFEHVWEYRYACLIPNRSEQGAAMMGVFDALVYFLSQKYPQRKTYQIKRDQGRVCCIPVSHCEFPEGSKIGSKAQRNRFANVSPQGCFWNWQEATLFNPETTSFENLQKDHPYIAWEVDLRERLNSSHPVKEMDCANRGRPLNITQFKIITHNKGGGAGLS